MVAELKPGSVCVDQRGGGGGNIIGTEKDKVVNGQRQLIGYRRELAPRVDVVCFYANNQLQWILSAGPTTTKTRASSRSTRRTSPCAA